MSNLILFSLLILLLVVVQFSRGMTIGRLINLHLEAVGGAARVNDLHFLTLSGTMRLPQLTGTFRSECQRGVSMRVDVDFPETGSATLLLGSGKSEKQIRTGDTTNRHPLSPGELPFAVDSVDLFGTFFLFRRKNATLKYLGREVLEGTACYKISSVNPSGGLSFHYLRCDSLQQIRSVKRVESDGIWTERTTDFSDYRPHGSGLVFPHQISATGYSLTVEQITTR
jgi:hypothetical protein